MCFPQVGYISWLVIWKSLKTVDAMLMCNCAQNEGKSPLVHQALCDWITLPRFHLLYIIFNWINSCSLKDNFVAPRVKTVYMHTVHTLEQVQEEMGTLRSSKWRNLFWNMEICIKSWYHEEFALNRIWIQCHLSSTKGHWTFTFTRLVPYSHPKNSSEF